MLGPWAVPGGTNADEPSETHAKPFNNEADMVATTSAQVDDRQVGLVSDRAGGGSTPSPRIPLGAGQAACHPEAGIPPEPTERADTREGKVPLERVEMRLRSRRRIIRSPLSTGATRTAARESLAQAREQQRYEDQEKRLLARLESLCLDAGRRNSQHEQQQEQKVEKSLEEIPRGSEVRRRLRLSFVDPESLEKGVGDIRKEEQQRALQECGSRSKKVEARKAELQEVLEKERAFQREPFEGRRVAKEEQKQVEEEQCRAEVAQRSAELVVAEVEATWTVTVEQPVIDMIQQEGAASKKVWMFVEPGAEELKEQALVSVGDSHLLVVESVSVGAVEAVEAKCKSERKEDSCEEKTTSQHAKREKERGKQPNYAGRRRWPGRQVAMKASKGTRMKGNCTLGVRGESAWRCKRGAAWGKQLRGKGFGAAGKSSGGARVKSGEGVRQSAKAQKVNDTSSGGNESECGESGCAADGQKRQQKKEGDKEKQLPGVQHRGGSMLGVEGVDGRRIEIEFAASSAGQVSSVFVRGSKRLRMEYDGGGTKASPKRKVESSRSHSFKEELARCS